MVDRIIEALHSATGVVVVVLAIGLILALSIVYPAVRDFFIP